MNINKDNKVIDKLYEEIKNNYKRVDKEIEFLKSLRQKLFEIDEELEKRIFELEDNK